MPIIASYFDDKGNEWQLWRSTRANDPLGPMYLVKKYPSGATKLSAWGLRDTRSSTSGTEGKTAMKLRPWFWDKSIGLE
jgi:hypothetical protein